MPAGRAVKPTSSVPSNGRDVVLPRLEPLRRRSRSRGGRRAPPTPSRDGRCQPAGQASPRLVPGVEPAVDAAALRVVAVAGLLDRREVAVRAVQHWSPIADGRVALAVAGVDEVVAAAVAGESSSTARSRGPGSAGRRGVGSCGGSLASHSGSARCTSRRSLLCPLSPAAEGEDDASGVHGASCSLHRWAIRPVWCP